MRAGTASLSGESTDSIPSVDCFLTHHVSQPSEQRHQHRRALSRSFILIIKKGNELEQVKFNRAGFHQAVAVFETMIQSMELR
jgi:hypothetical protein